MTWAGEEACWLCGWRVQGTSDVAVQVQWSTAIHAIGALWLTFVTAIFMLPAAYPVTTVVGAPLAFGLVVCPVLLSWFAWSRHWFSGPMPDVFNSDVSGSKSIVCQAGVVVQQVLIHSCSL